jgi:hypothetical protein
MDLSTTRLGPIANGHLCFPYETEEEKARTLVAFVREGLARRERCLYIAVAAEQERFLALLEAEGVATEPALERGELVLASQGETYLRTGRFDADDVISLLEGLTDRALADGFVGLRATGEASAPPTDELWAQAMRYESLVNERLARRPFLALCRFDAGVLPPARVQDVLRTHPHALLRGEVCANPFYERPEVVGTDDARARLDWQLHQLRSHHRARRRLEARAAAPGDESHAARARDRFLSVLVDELADPLFALKREVAALGAALDQTPVPERLEAAQHHLRRLSAAVEQARDMARLLEAESQQAQQDPPRRPRG